MAKKQSGSTEPHLVLKYLEGISSEIFSKYSDQITAKIGRQQGIYALYRDDHLYYVGLASNLRRRVKQHLRDQHAEEWNKFSVYLIRHSEHIKELESFVLRIAQPEGNKVHGKLQRADDLWPALNRELKHASALEIKKLLGGKGKGRATRSKSNRPTERKANAGPTKRPPFSANSPALAPYVTNRFILRGSNKGKNYQAWVHGDGTIKFQGKKYYSPSGAGKAALGRSVNGWTFWT